MTDRADYIWYTKKHKPRVLSLLKIPDAEERARRGVLIGLRFWPHQCQPNKRGPQVFNLLAGNFLGYETDPGRIRAECEITEIEPGLFRGDLRPAFFESERYTARAKAQLERDLTRLARQAGELETAKSSDAAAKQEATLRLFRMVALRCNVRRPEKLSIEALGDIYQGVVLTDEFEVPSLEAWHGLHVQAFAAPEPVTLENVGDWEKHLGAAMAGSVEKITKIARKLKAF